jgi:hypothetical protein
MKPRQNSLFQRLFKEIEGISLFDSHEHTWPEADRNAFGFSFFDWFRHYAGSDLVSAGLSPITGQSILTPSPMSFAERWAAISPFWQSARFTGYGRALLLAARDLYDVDDINDQTWQGLNDRILAANQPGLYWHVLRERANIEHCIVDPQEPGVWNQELFSQARRWDNFAQVWRRQNVSEFGRPFDLEISSLDDYLKALDYSFERAVAAGIVGLKIGVAYTRSILFEAVSNTTAETIFERLVDRPPVLIGTEEPPALSQQEAKPLQDYLFHQVIRRAIDCGWPIQIHTGMHEGNGNILRNSDPTLLTNLLLQYPQARWDLFHAGYPWSSHMAVLGKNFRGVHVNLCWLWIISPEVARRTLSEWLDTVPVNKIIAFGGDYLFVEGTYAHSRMAREGVARVLSEKVETGYLSEEEAMQIAQLILHDNAARLFGLLKEEKQLISRG